MARRRYTGGSNRKEAETGKYQPEEINHRVLENSISDEATKSPDDFIENNSFSDSEELVRNKKSNKSKHSCAEICCKYNDYDCNFACDSEKELLIRIICLLINKEYGLKAIEQKIRKSELNDDIKNINSITDLLERAIVGLGETALGAVEKAVDAAGTMSDITSGLAKIAAGAAGTAGSVAFTSQGLANVAAGTVGTDGAAAFTAQGLANIASGTAGTAGAAAHTVSGLTNTAAGTAGAVAAGAATAGAAADVAAETAGLAAASAATVGVAGDVAAETAGLAAAGAATVGVVGDIAAETAGLAAAGASTAEAAGDILAEAAGAAAAISSTTTSAAETAANVAATAAIATTAAKVPVVLDNESDTIHVCIINNNSKPSGIIRILMTNLSGNAKTNSYEQSITVPAASAVFLTITSSPAEYEIQINGLSQDICAYFVVSNKANNILSSQTPVEAKVLYVFPYAGK